MKRTLIIAWLTVVCLSQAVAQLQLTLPALSADGGTTLSVPVSLTNSSAVTALQFEVTFPTDFDYTGIALTARKGDHTVSASVVSPGLVRVLIYSATQTALSGSSGAVVNMSFKVSSKTGSYAIGLSNAVLSNQAGASLTATTTAGSISVNGPIAEISTSQIDYGRVVSGTYGYGYVTIYNRGNRSFNISSAAVSDAHFVVASTVPATVNANSSMTLTVRFYNSTGDDSFAGDLTLTTTDPEATRASFKVSLKATAYSLNTAQLGSVSGKTRTEVRIPVTMSNQVPLSAIQLEVSLPDSARYVANSITRGTAIPSAFQVTANQVGRLLKIICYTTDKTTISASNGEYFAFKVVMNEYPSSYPVTFSQAILTDTRGQNVLSSSTNGAIQLTSPRLSVSSSIAYGVLNVGQAVYEKAFSISNTGNEPLIVSAINFSNTKFRVKSVTLPFTVTGGSSKNLVMQLTDVDPGLKSAEMTVLSNERTPVISSTLSAEIIANFEIAALNLTARPGNQTQCEISLRNDLNISAFQFDLTLPQEISPASLSLVPTNRLAGWSLECSKLANGQFRIMAYSPTNAAITGTTGVVFSIPFQMPTTMVQGNYNITLSNVIIANSKGENSVTKSTNGVITVTAVPTALSNTSTGQPVICRTTEGVLITTASPSVIELYDLSGRLLYRKSNCVGRELVALPGQFVGVVRAVSAESVVQMKVIK